MSCSNGTFDFGADFVNFVVKNSKLYLCIVFTICVPVVLNNLVVIIVIVKTKLLRQKHNIFVLSLAVCDCMIGILYVVIVICYHNKIIFIDTYVISYILYSLIFTSISNVTAVAVDRSLALVFIPLRYESIVTIKRLLVSCFCLWVGPLAIQPVLHFYSESEIDLRIFSTTCLIALTATAIFYLIIYQKISECDQRLTAMGVKGVNSSTILLKTFSIIIGVSMILWLPYLVISICVSFQKIACSFGTSYVLVYIISHLITIVNSLINPIIYWCRLSDFRNAVKHIFCRRCSVLSQYRVGRGSSAPPGRPRISLTEGENPDRREND
ncbi:melanocortin receptor 4-like [Anneissia japonica]|uniref:melanocortin receptor 4-like n=1 Tax=Anneissia japonica TaxID=1529436 RepID=UPI001425AA28|nr:melanocortin receptor 4-like [Anneissia japonica]